MTFVTHIDPLVRRLRLGRRILEEYAFSETCIAPVQHPWPSQPSPAATST